MKRTFNYTGRQRIDRKNVSITLREDAGVLVFDADLKLGDYHFSRQAEVWVEAHRQNLWMQFPWGTVSALKPASNRRLTEFDVSEGILFRVRVVQPQGQEHHKLLGEADGIPFVKVGQASTQRRPLLEPVPDDLDQLLWKLDFESDPPRLLINRDARPTWKDLARSPYFIALVYPEVLRRVLNKILIDDDKWTEDDEESGWQTDWIKFSKSLSGLGGPPPADEEENRRNWIEEVVAAFARRHQLKTMLDLNFEEGQK